MATLVEEVSLLLHDGRPIPCVLLAQAATTEGGPVLLRLVDEAGYTQYNIETDELVKPHATR